MKQWILVKDRLPNSGEDFLVAFLGWDDTIFQRVLYYDNQSKEWSDWNGEVYDKVIAWQPLPSDIGLTAY